MILAAPVPHRDRWQGERDFASFADWDRHVAASSGAYFVDLTMLVSEGYRAVGAATVDTFFADARTHTNGAGADFNAARVVAGLKALPGNPLGAFFSVTSACTSWGTRGALLYANDFAQPLAGFVAEYARAPGNVIDSRDGRLNIDVGTGATVWLDRPLRGDVALSYTRRVVMAGGPNDRVSDLNQFWMARDPRNANLFTRGGTFEDYDNLELYYVGIGGNTNTTTRMRRYAAMNVSLLRGQ